MKNVLLLCVFLIASCSVKSVQTDIPAGTDPREQELRKVIAEAEPLIRNLLNALNAGDYKSYCKDFDSRSPAACTEEQFKTLQADIKKKLGLYEDGKYQVHKIEQYPASHIIFYFVKFQNAGSQNPAVIAVKVKKTEGKLEILDISYRHALLEA